MHKDICTYGCPAAPAEALSSTADTLRSAALPAVFVPENKGM